MISLLNGHRQAAPHAATPGWKPAFRPLAIGGELGRGFRLVTFLLLLLGYRLCRLIIGDTELSGCLLAGRHMLGGVRGDYFTKRPWQNEPSRIAEDIRIADTAITGVAIPADADTRLAAPEQPGHRPGGPGIAFDPSLAVPDHVEIRDRTLRAGYGRGIYQRHCQFSFRVG
jgi:hypothetical protein